MPSFSIFIDLIGAELLGLDICANKYCIGLVAVPEVTYTWPSVAIFQWPLREIGKIIKSKLNMAKRKATAPLSSIQCAVYSISHKNNHTQ